MHDKMTAEHKAAFTRLLPLTPTNIHRKTNCTFGQHADFETIWFKHSPTAARYYLFTSLWNGKLDIYDEHDGEPYPGENSSDEVSDNETA